MDAGVRLLVDMGDVFGDADRIRSDTLVERLLQIEDASWSSLRRGPLKPAGLARRLCPFDIRPASIRIGDATPKGYLRAQFLDIWDRYLPVLSDPQQPQQVQQDGADVADVAAPTGQAPPPPDHLFEGYIPPEEEP